MNYRQSLDFIHGIARFGSKPGLRRVRQLVERMGNPQKQLKFIHVAGTNGKGSTCAMLSNTLTRAGYRTGLYISPFVLDFRERIQLNNQMIDPQDFAAGATLVKTHWDTLDAAGDTPSEFETLVAVAFDYFLRQKADIVVLEVGMGGRFDATNVIDTPVASVITSLGLEHTEYLGDTLDLIATEKCGIIKPGGVTVCYPEQEPEAMARVATRCREEDNPLIIPHAAEVLKADFFGTQIRYGDLELNIPLIGAHQVLNTATVLETLNAVGRRGFPVAREDIIAGIGATFFPARLEVIGRGPLIVLDGAHNPSGAKVLGQALEMLAGRKIHALMGMLGNKDAGTALGEILPHCASLTAVPVPENPLSLDPRRLGELARPLCDQVEVFPTPEAGLQAAWGRLESEEDVLLVCGSLYLASHIRPMLFALAQK